MYHDSSYVGSPGSPRRIRTATVVKDVAVRGIKAAVRVVGAGAVFVPLPAVAVVGVSAVAGAAFAGAASAGAATTIGGASVVTNRCAVTDPAMPSSTGTAPPSGFAVQMAGATLAPASSSAALAAAYDQFNEMTCSQYTHRYREAPPRYYYYDCVGFTGYTVRVADPVAWRSVRRVVGLRSPGVVPTPWAFVRFFDRLASVPQSGWAAVPTVRSIRPGDVLAWQPALADGRPNRSGVGHSVMPLVTPRAMPGSGGRRWEVVVMDSTAGGHGPDDTRRPSNPLSERNAPIVDKQGHPVPSGLGIGTLVLDTDARGVVTGVEWSVGAQPEAVVFGAARPLR
jgi:hypothetical protein